MLWAIAKAFVVQLRLLKVGQAAAGIAWAPAGEEWWDG